MKTTIEVSVNGVCEGFDFVGSRISKTREYWVNMQINGTYHKESAQTYKELAKILEAKYGLIIPAEKSLHWYNYNTPYNSASFSDLLPGY